jgi:hypothetical protein
MAFEVACSQCQGRLMVEQAGVIVACPHCGAHLTIEQPAANDGTEQVSVVESKIDEQPEPAVAEASSQSDVDKQFTMGSGVSAEGVLFSSEPETAVLTELPGDAALVNELPETSSTFAEIPREQMPSSGNLSAPATVAEQNPVNTASGLQASVPLGQGATTPSPSAPVLSVQPGSTALPNAIPAGIEANDVGRFPRVASAGGRGISRHTFTLLRNYAIAMTLAVLFLVFKLLNPNTSALESLPDVKPQKKNDKIVYKLVPEATEMPPGHLLSLGESQRFGNLKVTPVRVTREPVEFVHHLGDTAVTREPGPDVVKLWFEFENLSSNQQIAPLDGLVFKRDDNDFENIRSNNFVCRESEKKKSGELVFVYDLNENDIWVLRGQNVQQEIAPGEKLQTYIPTSEEGLAQLLNSKEPLIWRVHFRKGYSPQNYGVTTVIEVAFESSDIGRGSAAPKAAEPGKAEAT